MNAWIARRVSRMMLPPRMLWMALSLSYLPLLLGYFAHALSGMYGMGTGLTTVASSFWKQESLGLSPEQFAFAGFILGLPWFAKTLLGQLVDSWSITVRKRVLIGCGILMALGFLLLSGFAGNSPLLIPIEQFFGYDRALPLTGQEPKLLRYQFVLYTLGYLVVSVTMCLQDAILDPLGRHLVSRFKKNGAPYPDHVHRRRIGMLQTACRISFTVASLCGLIVGGILMHHKVPMSTIFLFGLITPTVVMLAIGSLKLPAEIPVSGMEKRIVLLAICVLVLSIVGQLFEVPGSGEVVFVGSLIAIITLLRILRSRSTLPPATMRGMLFTATAFFLVGFLPSAGDGISWWQRDVLKFDRSFETTLSIIGTGIALFFVVFLYRKTLSGHLGKLLIALTAILSLFGLITVSFWYGSHVYLGGLFGIEPLQMVRYMAYLDTAASSPFAMLYGMLTFIFIAQYASHEGTATWMTIFASFFNLSGTASSLGTKYLNIIYPVERGRYENVGDLLWSAWTINTVGAILIIILVLTPWRKSSEPLLYSLWCKLRRKRPSD